MTRNLEWNAEDKVFDRVTELRERSNQSYQNKVHIRTGAVLCYWTSIVLCLLTEALCYLVNIQTPFVNAVNPGELLVQKQLSQWRVRSRLSPPE